MPRKMPINGTLLLNKPSGITSHDAVMQVRRIVMQRRIGHTGTLDPRAEGLLIVCLGRATKLVPFLSDFDKTYEAEITLGKTSATYDGEGIDFNQKPFDAPKMTETQLDQFLDQFRGKITQRVPAYSAVRVQGRRLYEMARNNEPVEPPEREVEIREIRLLAYQKPHLTIEVTCSKGTYIRSLAHDIGQKLQCGGYLSFLRRTRIGQFSLDDAITLQQVEHYYEQGEFERQLLPNHEVLNYPAVTVTDEFRKQVISGRDLTKVDVVKVDDQFETGQKMMLRDTNGRVLAIGTAEVSSEAILHDVESKQKLFTYIRVLN